MTKICCYSCDDFNAHPAASPRGFSNVQPLHPRDADELFSMGIDATHLGLCDDCLAKQQTINVPEPAAVAVEAQGRLFE
jgi:hypothetical protein